MKFWGYHWLGWLFFAFWMAAIVFGIGWEAFVLHFGLRAVLVVSVLGIVWVVERLSRDQERNRK